MSEETEETEIPIHLPRVFPGLIEGPHELTVEEGNND